jgi:hypothetical protein
MKKIVLIAAASGIMNAQSKRHERHAVRREGDEQACSCGKRWPVGEAHP